MKQTLYNFKVTFKDNTNDIIQATSYKTVYEYFLYTPRLEKCLDDIKDIELIYQYKYHSYRKHCLCLAELTQSQYDKLAEKYYANKDLLSTHNINSIDDYIKSVLAISA